MRVSEVFIDSNLLTLLVVGKVDRGKIAQHRRTRAFSKEHYDRLLAMIGTARIFVTPHILAETSNLLATKPIDARLLRGLRALIGKSEEITVLGKTAACHKHFPSLGLTDACLLQLISKKRPLLTVDSALCAIALAEGELRAFNFHHFMS